MKPFKETLVGKFLIDKGIPAAKMVGDLLPNNGVFGIAKNIISTATELTEEDKNTATELMNQEIDLFKMELEDTQSARDMQKSALAQDDPFIKRFTAYLTIVITGSSLILVAALYFVVIPEKNKELVYMAIGLFLGGFSSAINFWMGTTFSSRGKQEAIYKATGISK